jgi:uncharacterized protein YyaL (SSP411 family)
MAGMQDVQLDETTLDWLIERIVDALAREERVAAAALHLLLRRFSTTGREEMAEPLGAALAREVHRQAGHGCDDDREGWVALFSEAAAISDDPRLPRAAADLVKGLRPRWSGPVKDVEEVEAVGDVMRSVEACLLAVNLPEARELAAEAIDALERVVAGAYRPGQGVAHGTTKTMFVRGGLSDHVRSASTLLTAYVLTARLPYAMLADELMQSVLRLPPSEPEGREASFAVNCELARVFCRLAALHGDEEYRRTAVLAVGENYAEEAAQTLAALASSVRERGVEAAPFGLALAEWLNLR